MWSGSSCSAAYAAELLEPVARARADGVGGDADADARRAQFFELREVRRDRLLAEAVDPAARVRDMEEDDLDPRLAGRLDRGVRLGDPEVVELADRGVARLAQLAIDVRVRRAHALRRLPRRELEHRLAPRPEVGARGPLAERALEGVAVGVHIHARILPTWRPSALPAGAEDLVVVALSRCHGLRE